MQSMLAANRVAVLVALLATIPALAAAQTQTFLLVPGIPGESLDDNHREWIQVSALRQALAPGTKGASCVVDVVKNLDKAGPRLWLAAVTGSLFREVLIEVERSGGDFHGSRLYEVRLRNAVITSIVTTGVLPFAETVTFKAQTLVLSYFPQRVDGSMGSPVTTTIPCN